MRREERESHAVGLCVCVEYRTLYCAKGNYEFGISRVIKSLEPYQKKLGTDTWYHAKRCFLSLIENMAKHMLMMKDAFLQECVQFLEACERKCCTAHNDSRFSNSLRPTQISCIVYNL